MKNKTLLYKIFLYIFLFISLLLSAFLIYSLNSINNIVNGFFNGPTSLIISDNALPFNLSLTTINILIPIAVAVLFISCIISCAFAYKMGKSRN
jgi:hypothetical protein